MWRSLVAHLAGGQVVAGSNPVIPTIITIQAGEFLLFFMCEFSIMMVEG